MPESRNRPKPSYTPPRRGASEAQKQRRWVAPVMLACFLLGLAWVVLFYIAGDQIPGVSALGNWNVLIGMGLIASGFVISTQWH